MNKYTYYRPTARYIGMRLTKGTFKEVVKLIAKHGAVTTYAPDAKACSIVFSQQWPRGEAQKITRGDYITSENYGLRVHRPYEFKSQFEQVYDMSRWYIPTNDEVAIIKCLNSDAEYCYAYDWICGEAGLDRAAAKKAIDNLRRMGVVAFYRGLMNDDGEVCGSGFCIGDLCRAEALLYRYSQQGGKE